MIKSMQRTHYLLIIKGAAPIFFCSLQQCQRTNHICLCKDKRVLDAPVNMALCRKMNYAFNIVVLKSLLHKFKIADVSLYKRVILIFLYILQILKVSRISQLVKINDVNFGIFLHKQSYYAGANESCSSGYHYCFHKAMLIN